MKTQTYTKINTLHTRYMNLNKVELPNPKWKVFQNKIILDQYSDEFMEYIKDLKFDFTEKIDGTNSKIVYFPSTGECFPGGKTDNADIVGTGQKPFLDAIIERIKPILAHLFPPESAKFAPVMNDKNQILLYDSSAGDPDPNPISINEYREHSGYGSIHIEEVPVYIYGEFFGKKIQKGGNYDKDNNRFSVFDICQQGWYVPLDILKTYVNELGLDGVPYIGQMTIDEAEAMVMAGFKTTVPNVSNPDYGAEGIVGRPVVPIKDPRGKRIIVKIKTCDYNDLRNAVNQVGEEEYRKFDLWYKEHQKEIEGK